MNYALSYQVASGSVAACMFSSTMALSSWLVAPASSWSELFKGSSSSRTLLRPWICETGLASSGTLRLLSESLRITSSYCNNERIKLW